MNNDSSWRCQICDTENSAETEICHNCKVGTRPDDFEEPTVEKPVRKTTRRRNSPQKTDPPEETVPTPVIKSDETVEVESPAKPQLKPLTPPRYIRLSRSTEDESMDSAPIPDSPRSNKQTRNRPIRRKFSGNRRRVGLIGFSGSGKTVYLSMLYHATAETSGHFAPDWQSRWSQGDGGRTVRYLRDLSNRIRGIDAMGKTLYRDTSRTRIRRDWPEGTGKQTHLTFSLIKQLGLTHLNIDVETLDVAGEVLNQAVTFGVNKLSAESSTRWNEVISLCRNSDGLMIFISLLSFEETRDEGNLRLLIELLDQESALPKTVAIVATGADLYTSEEERTQVLGLVRQRYERALDVLELSGITTECFLVSSIGQRMTRKKTENLSPSCLPEDHICALCQELSDTPGIEPEPTDLAAPWEFFLREFTPAALRSPFVAQSVSLLATALLILRRPVSLILLGLLFGTALVGREYIALRQAITTIENIEHQGLHEKHADSFLKAHRKRAGSLLARLVAPVGDEERKTAAQVEAFLSLKADLDDISIPVQQRLDQLQHFTDPANGHLFAASISKFEKASEIVQASLISESLGILDKIRLLKAIQSRAHPFFPELYSLPLSDLFDKIHLHFSSRLDSIKSAAFIRNHHSDEVVSEIKEANEVLDILRAFGHVEEAKPAWQAVENWVHTLSLAQTLRSIMLPPPSGHAEQQETIAQLTTFVQKTPGHPFSVIAEQERKQLQGTLRNLQEMEVYSKLPPMPTSADSLLEQDPARAITARRNFLSDSHDFARRATVESEIAQLERMAPARSAWLPIQSELAHVRNQAQAERMLGEVQDFLAQFGNGILGQRAQLAESALANFNAEKEAAYRSQLQALPALPKQETNLTDFNFTEPITARMNFLSQEPPGLVAIEAESQLYKCRALQQQWDRFNALSVNWLSMWNENNRRQAITELDGFISDFPSSPLLHKALHFRDILVNWNPIRLAYQVTHINSFGVNHDRIELILLEQTPNHAQNHLNTFPELPLPVNPAEPITFDFSWNKLFPLSLSIRVYDRRTRTFSAIYEVKIEPHQYPEIFRRPVDFGPVSILFRPYQP